MPIYVYRNLTTGETFEVTQRMTDAALTEHPETGDPVKRLIQPVGIAFKGSGFYVTDNRSGKGASKAGSTPSGSNGAKSSDGAGGSTGATAKDGAASKAKDVAAAAPKAPAGGASD